MECIFCGAQIPDQSGECPVCKSKLQIVPDYNDFYENINELVGQDDPPVHIKDDEEEKKRTRREDKKTRQERHVSRKRILLIGCLFLLLVLFIVYTAIRMRIKREHALSYPYQVSQAEEAMESGDYTTALSYYETALSLAPEDTQVRCRMAEIYELLGQKEEEIRIYREILELDPENPEVWQTLLALYEQEEDLNAILELKESATLPAIIALFADYEVTEPVFSSEGGSYDTFFDLTLSCPDGYEIYYSLDGSDPSRNGTLYEAPIEFHEEQQYIVTAVCKNKKDMYGPALVEVYEIEIPAPEMPVVSPETGDFVYRTKVYISVPENCIAYYTWNGSDPDASSKQVKNSLTVPEGNHVLSVILYDTKTGKWSDVFKGCYTYYPDSLDDDDTDDTTDNDAASEETGS